MTSEKKTECKHYGTMIPESTCIERQEYIHLAKSKDVDSEDVRKAKRIAPFYNETCKVCEYGIDLFKQKKGEIIPMEIKKTAGPVWEKFTEPAKTEPKTKQCATCKRILPATHEFFDPANRAADNLRKDCTVCVGKNAIAKEKTRTVFPETPKAGTGENVKSVEKRTCPSCGEEKDLTVENFHRKGPGFFYSCKNCRNLQKRQNRSIRHGLSKEKLIVLNFVGLEELKEDIETWAQNEMRDPASQILYHLKTMIQQSGAA